MNILPYNKDRDFVAFVNDVNIAKEITKDDYQKLISIIDKYVVLVFKKQKLTDDQQVKFT